MPYAAPRPCKEPGCGRLTRSGARCDEHAKQQSRRYDQQRESSTQRGYGAAWQRARLGYLRKHPLCVFCRARGLLVAATVVDHIVPHGGDWDRFWDSTNWQSLCKPCHDRDKQRLEAGGRGKVGGSTA